jgi:hypothetical protein
MPQVSIYVDRETLKKIAQAARKERSSVSKWVQKSIRRSLGSGWPDSYERLFGSLKDMGFERPPQGSFGDDVRREKP